MRDEFILWVYFPGFEFYLESFSPLRDIYLLRRSRSLATRGRFGEFKIEGEGLCTTISRVISSDQGGSNDNVVRCLSKSKISKSN